MNYIDLHCDALYKSVTKSLPLDSDKLETKLADKNDRKLQCYAIWLPDNLSGDEAESLFFKAYKKLNAECVRCKIKLISGDENLKNNFFQYNNCAYFTVENASAINGKLENIKKFSQLGVKMITLTWNSHNIIGAGADCQEKFGLTDFGIQAVAEMEKQGIIVDISHSNEHMFYDVAKIATHPIVASHSNSRKIATHKRNLSDEQFNIIKQSGGIVGINFHNAFLNNNPQNASLFDILRHTEHFLSIGGEDTVCIGSDFDGGVLPKDIHGSDSFSDIYELFLRHNYSEHIVNKIFFKNALNFFENFDNNRIM